jgi:hypothetical protein
VALGLPWFVHVLEVANSPACNVDRHVSSKFTVPAFTACLAGRLSCPPTGITANGSAGGSGRATDGGSPTAAAAAAAASSNKQMSKGQLLTELQAMRARMAEEQSKRMEAEAEKVCQQFKPICCQGHCCRFGCLSATAHMSCFSLFLSS